MSDEALSKAADELQAAVDDLNGSSVLIPTPLIRLVSKATAWAELRESDGFGTVGA